MIVSNEQYDTQLPSMRKHTLAPLRWEFAKTPGELFVTPISWLPVSAKWLLEIAPADLAAAQLDWQFLIPPHPDRERPALVRLDTLFPDQRRLAVLWTVASSDDYTGLSFAAVADKIVFTLRAGAIAVEPLGLDDLDEFEQVGQLVRATFVFGAGARA